MSASASSQLTRANCAVALGAHALQRVQDAVGMVDALEVVIDLGAERAARERMRGIAGQPLGQAVAHLDDPAAGVRAVVSAGAADDIGRRVRQSGMALAPE